MIWPNLGDVNELRRVHEAAPEQDVEPDEEDSCGKSSFIGCAQELCCQCCFEDQRCETASCPDQEKWSSTESINLTHSSHYL